MATWLGPTNGKAGNNGDLTDQNGKRGRQGRITKDTATSLADRKTRNEENQYEIHLEKPTTPVVPEQRPMQLTFSSIYIQDKDVATGTERQSTERSDLLQTSELANSSAQGEEGRKHKMESPSITTTEPSEGYGFIHSTKSANCATRQIPSAEDLTKDSKHNPNLDDLVFKEEKVEMTNSANNNGSTFDAQKGVCFGEYNKHMMNYPLAIHGSRRDTHKKNVFTFVRPSPKKTAGASSSYLVSRTRKLAGTLLSKGSHSDPYLTGASLSATFELKQLERSLRGGSHSRVYEGGRLLFCKKRLKREDEPLLSPRGSPSQEDLSGQRTWSEELRPRPPESAISPVLADDTLTTDHRVTATETLSVSRSFGRSLTRQKSFEVDDNSIDRSTNTLSLLKPIAGILDSYPSNITMAFDDASAIQSNDVQSRESTALSPTTKYGADNEESLSVTTTSSGSISFMEIPALVYTNSMQASSIENQARVTARVAYKPASVTADSNESAFPVLARAVDNISDVFTYDVTRIDDVKYDVTSSNDVFMKPVTSEDTFSPPSSSKDRSSGYSSSYLCVTGPSSPTHGRRLSETLKCPSDLLVPDDGGLMSSSERTFVKSSSSISAPPSMNDISDVSNGDVAMTIDSTLKFVSESATLGSVPRSRIKLALSNPHAGIFVTGDSQDDPDFEPEARTPIERCPSWLGDQTGSSLFLSPSKTPEENQETTNNIVVYEKKKTGPISFSSKQKSDTFQGTSSSSPLLSTQYRSSSGSATNDAPKGKGYAERSKSALLSPSFRTIQNKSQHAWTTKCAEVYSSGDSARSSFKEGDTHMPRRRLNQSGSKEIDLNSSYPPPRVRKTAALTPPNLRARSHDFDPAVGKQHRSSSTYLSPYYHSSVSSEGDSGLDTPRSYDRRKQRRGRISKGTTSNPTLRTHAQYSSQDRCQSKSSLSQSVKSTSSFIKMPFKKQEGGGSFLSLISPKRLFVRRKNSDQSGKSSASRASRKRLSDFPDDGKIIVINVSGRIFKLHEYFTSVYPETLLGSNRRNQYYDPTREEYFFDHDPDVFRHIWNFYYTGKLHYPKDECVELFLDEIQFFGISDHYTCTCCWEDEYDPAKEKLEKIRENNRKREEEEQKSKRKIPADATLKHKIWLTTKDPMVSIPAKTFYFFSVLAIVLSTFANIAETITCDDSLKSCEGLNQLIYFYIDTICVVFFTLEYALKIITAPNRWQFAKKFMSIVDVLAILPYYCDLLLKFVLGSENNLGIEFLEILRILRIVRIFKLLRHSRRLQDLTETVKGSTTELGLILFIYFVLVIVFSSIMYYAEMQDNPKFVSIPEAMWYAVIATTTTGYGDIVPETVFGKVIGCACCILGVLVVALPVPILQIKS